MANKNDSDKIVDYIVSRTGNSKETVKGVLAGIGEAFSLCDADGSLKDGDSIKLGSIGKLVCVIQKGKKDTLSGVPKLRDDKLVIKFRRDKKFNLSLPK